MTKARQLALVILGFSAACGWAQTEPWPPDVRVSPQNPSPGSMVTLTVSDTWSTDCVPRGIIATDIRDHSIYITVGQVMYFVCNPKATFWQEECTVGPVAAGCYDVYVAHGTASQLTRPFALATTFCVGSTVPGGTGGSACFPRPAYDSGWIDMPKTGTAPYTTTLAHNLGGNVDDYVVDLQRRDSGRGVTNLGLGSTFFYSELTAQSIKLSGPLSPKDTTISLRVRIWVYNCDRPCLVDFAPYERPGQGVSPSTIRAGQTLNLKFGVANNGTEAIAPGWRVQYYASSDTKIQPSDYLLYEATADFGINAGQQLALEEAFAFPSTVPAGQYYIGWIFDPRNEVCESNEDNNTGCVCTTGGRLTVTSDQLR